MYISVKTLKTLKKLCSNVELGKWYLGKWYLLYVDITFLTNVRKEILVYLLDSSISCLSPRKSSPFCGARKSVTFLTRAPYLSIYWAVLIQCKSSSIIYLMFVSIRSSHLRLAVTVDPVLSLSPNAVLYTFPKTSCRSHYSNPPLFSHMFTLHMFVYVDKTLDLKSCLCYQVWLLNNEASRAVHVLHSWLPK